MSEPIYTPQSERDLTDIHSYIAETHPLNADRFIRAVLDTVLVLNDRPRIGRKRFRLMRGLYSFPHGNYLILYRIAEDRIIVHRIIHGSRILRRTMFSND